uniref:Ubiquitin-like domain-containing protein n=1 Tax=Ditylum brightwellii TaxID=49249 RepID=A0A6S9B284_9STRA|mmetsp:Transcript_27206/g.36141  ORF Transcript_27206/g.36141 Transcript_27206/m.36141 type:complete len:136 (-) Transcript_27206:162-569(-)
MNTSNSSTKKQMYVRIKRRNQTFFIQANRSDTIFHLKDEISNALNNEISPRKMRLYLSSTTSSKDSPPIPTPSSPPLPDSATLADHDVKNDAILFVVFRKPEMSEDDDDDGELCWEDVELYGPASSLPSADTPSM